MVKNSSTYQPKKHKTSKKRLREKKWDKRLEDTFPASDAVAKY